MNNLNVYVVLIIVVNGQGDKMKAKEKIKSLERCNDCLKWQLNNEQFECVCGIDNSCEWTRREIV